MKKVIYVDGLSGTTGLKIRERLNLYSEIELIEIPYEKRRDRNVRAQYLNEADLVFLCLPDDAAIESVNLIKNPKTKVIDASTAHRTAQGWDYGLPELSKEHRRAISQSHRVCNPGCHATAFLLSIKPLTNLQIIPEGYPLSCQSITGYSGGGKDLIDKYELEEKNHPYKKAPRPYSLNLNHKHLREMTYHSSLVQSPIFIPVVGDFYQGLATTITLHQNALNKKINSKEIHTILSEYYKGEPFVKVMPYEDDSFLFDGGLDLTACNGTNRAELFVFGNHMGHTAIMTRIDNLGKGASGAAIQNMNLMLEFEEGLHLL